MASSYKTRDILPAPPIPRTLVGGEGDFSARGRATLQEHAKVKQHRHRHRPEDWEALKDLFKQLYIEADNSLEDVVGIIQREKNFVASIRQYKNKIQHWGFEKHLKASDMQVLLAKREERKRVRGVETVFQFGGITLDDDRISRFGKRQKFGDAVSPSAATPNQVDYCTPKPIIVSESIDPGIGCPLGNFARFAPCYQYDAQGREVRDKPTYPPDEPDHFMHSTGHSVEGPVASRCNCGAQAAAPERETVKRGLMTFSDTRCPSNALSIDAQISVMELDARFHHYLAVLHHMLNTKNVCATILEESHFSGRWPNAKERLFGFRIVVLVTLDSQDPEMVTGTLFSSTEVRRRAIGNFNCGIETVAPGHQYAPLFSQSGFESVGIIENIHVNPLLSTARSRVVVTFCPFKVSKSLIHQPQDIPLYVFLALSLSYFGHWRIPGEEYVLVTEVVLLSTPRAHGPACFCYAASCILLPAFGSRTKQFLLPRREAKILMTDKLAGHTARDSESATSETGNGHAQSEVGQS